MNRNNNAIPIVSAANEYFIPYTAAMIQSVMENANPKNQYRFFIMHSGIPAAVLDTLSSQTVKFPHCSLEGIDVSGRIQGCAFFTANRPDLTAEAYYRLFIPELLAEYDKVIYLDGDMICRSDISRLFAFDLGDNLIGAARDIAGLNSFFRDGKNTDAAYYDVKSNMHNPCDYYCDGMLLFNNKQFRQKISTAELLDWALSKKWKVHDQDVFNVVTAGRTCFLPYSWNFILPEGTDYLPENLAKEYAESIGHEDIIHFAGGKKPWTDPVFIDPLHIK